MFWLGGFPALEVTTSTPDALCPPLEEARAAILARVGEVRGAYHVDFALVRADDGRQLLKLVVREQEQQVLERELPLDAAGCQDAAQAIALVLERYFDAVEEPHAAAQHHEPIPVSPSEQLSRNAPTPRSTEPRKVELMPPESSSERTFRARAGFIYDRELGIGPSLGAGLFPVGFRLTRSLQVGVSLDLAPFLTKLSERVRGEEISARTLQTALSFPLALRLESWSAAVGPWAQLRLQRAEAPSLLHQRTAYRAVPGFGGFAQLGRSIAPDWTLALGFALGAQATKSTSRFVLRRVDAEPSPVLVPEPWFAQAQLTISFAL